MNKVRDEEQVPASKAGDLLLADLKHFGDSMWHNEEVGEKRFNFFLTLVTAVVAGLVALARYEGGFATSVLLLQVSPIALLALLAIGLMTYFRMLQRNRVTDEYQRISKSIRRRYVTLYREIAPYTLDFRKPRGIHRWLKGGYAETIGVINGMLLYGFLTLDTKIKVEQHTEIILSALFVALQWAYAIAGRKKS